MLILLLTYKSRFIVVFGLRYSLYEYLFFLVFFPRDFEHTDRIHLLLLGTTRIEAGSAAFQTVWTVYKGHNK